MAKNCVKMFKFAEIFFDNGKTIIEYGLFAKHSVL